MEPKFENISNKSVVEVKTINYEKDMNLKNKELQCEAFNIGAGSIVLGILSIPFMPTLFSAGMIVAGGSLFFLNK